MFRTALALAVLLWPGVCSGVTLIRDGRPMATIVLPNDPKPVERAAAIDLQRCLRRMSGDEEAQHAEDEVLDGDVEVHCELMLDSDFEYALVPFVGPEGANCPFRVRVLANAAVALRRVTRTSTGWRRTSRGCGRV